MEEAWRWGEWEGRGRNSNVSKLPSKKLYYFLVRRTLLSHVRGVEKWRAQNVLAKKPLLLCPGALS
jgi:hypothetical protein